MSFTERPSFEEVYEEVINNYKNYVEKTGDSSHIDLREDSKTTQLLKDIAFLIRENGKFKHLFDSVFAKIWFEEYNIGVSSSPRMPSYMPYLVDVDNTVLSKCEDKVCFYDFEKEIFSNGADYAKDVFIECFESKSKEILKHLVETPMSHASLRVIYFECFDEKGINRKYLIECEMTSKKYIG